MASVQTIASMVALLDEVSPLFQEFKNIIETDDKTWDKSKLMSIIENILQRDDILDSRIQRFVHKLDGIYEPVDYAIAVTKFRWMRLSCFITHWDLLCRLDYMNYHDRNIMRNLFKFDSETPFKIDELFDEQDIYLCLDVDPLCQYFTSLFTLLTSKNYSNTQSETDRATFREIMVKIDDAVFRTKKALISSTSFEKIFKLSWKHRVIPVRVTRSVNADFSDSYSIISPPRSYSSENSIEFLHDLN